MNVGDFKLACWASWAIISKIISKKKKKNVDALAYWG